MQSFFEYKILPMAGFQQQDSHAGKEVATHPAAQGASKAWPHSAAHAPPLGRHRSTAVGVCRYHVQLDDFQFRLR